MKTYIIKIQFQGLTGIYYSNVEVRARNLASAIKKARQTIGDRDGTVVSDTLALDKE